MSTRSDAPFFMFFHLHLAASLVGEKIMSVLFSPKSRLSLAPPQQQQNWQLAERFTKTRTILTVCCLGVLQNFLVVSRKVASKPTWMKVLRADFGSSCDGKTHLWISSNIARFPGQDIAENGARGIRHHRPFGSQVRSGERSNWDAYDSTSRSGCAALAPSMSYLQC